MLFLAADEGLGTAAAVGGPEVDGVLIAVVVHIHNGASVTGNGLLGNRLGSKSLVRLGSGRRGLTGSAGLGFGFLEGEIIIVRVLLPVNHGVPGIGVALPVGGKGHALRQGAAKGERGIPVEPALEGIALPGGSGGLLGHGAGRHEGGSDVGAAVGIIGDPVTRLHLGVEGNVGAFNGDGAHPVGKTGIGVPAGDGLVSIHGECNIRGDAIAGDALLGGADHALRIQEEHIVHGSEGRGVGIGHTAGDLYCAGGESVAFGIEPTGKLVALLLGGRGGVNALAVLHPLGVHHCAVHSECVGSHRGVIHGLHNFQRRGGRVDHGDGILPALLGPVKGLGKAAGSFAGHNGGIRHADAVAIHHRDGKGQVLGGLFLAEGHGIVGGDGLLLIVGEGAGHMNRDGDLPLGGLLRLGLHRRVVHVDGLDTVGLGAGEGGLIHAVIPHGH